MKNMYKNEANTVESENYAIIGQRSIGETEIGLLRFGGSRIGYTGRLRSLVTRDDSRTKVHGQRCKL